MEVREVSVKHKQASGEWRHIADDREKYQAYLCSREWALLRNAVRERCGGKCERCKVNEMDCVHHLTYARKYDERLDDLAGWCNSCHEFTHGKSDHDPAERSPIVIPFCGRLVKTFYLAGKITGTDWRDAIVPNWSEENHSWTYSHALWNWDQAKRWSVVPAVCSVNGVTLDYAGPWWRDVFCHGRATSSYEPHGYGDDLGNLINEQSDSTIRQEIAAAVSSAVLASDMVFAWIDSDDAYGTLFEIGMAAGLDKCVVVAFETEFSKSSAARNMWLSKFNGYDVVAGTPKEAWDSFWSIVMEGIRSKNGPLVS